MGRAGPPTWRSFCLWCRLSPLPQGGHGCAGSPPPPSGEADPRTRPELPWTCAEGLAGAARLAASYLLRPASGLLMAVSSPAAHPGVGTLVLSLPLLLGPWGCAVLPPPSRWTQGSVSVRAVSGPGPVGCEGWPRGGGMSRRCRAGIMGTEGGWLAWCCLGSSRKGGRAEPARPLGAGP